MSALAAIESAMRGWESEYNVSYNDRHSSAVQHGRWYAVLGGLCDGVDVLADPG
jgi:hypothetical protein